MVGPRLPSNKAWRFLGWQIGTQDIRQLEGFTRMANGYSHETPITSGMVKRACDLATKGINEFGTLEELLEFASDPDAVMTPRNYIEIRYKARKLEPSLEAFPWVDTSGVARRAKFKGEPSPVLSPASAQTRGAVDALNKRRLAMAALMASDDPKGR